MRSRAGVILAVLALGPASSAVLASGYSVYEQGARAMANAGAFTARANDPSALFFNPAGITGLKGMNFSIGTNAIFLTGSSFDSDLSGNEFDQVDNMAWPSNLYYTQKIGERYAWGIGITSPFGLKTEWDNTFEGRYISRESNLAVVQVNPNFAWSFAKNWSAAVGVDFARADIRELSQNIDFSGFGAPDGFTKLTGDGDDFGWNLAVRWASAGWAWGASYRSEMKPQIDGNVEFENVPAPLTPLIFDGPASAELPLPASFVTGLSYTHGKWEGEFDVLWTGWSTFDHLRIDIENNTPAMADIDQFEDWHDSYSYRIGYSYHLNDRSELRFGGYLDKNPIPTAHVRPRLPDADRTSVQVGYGYATKGGFTFDVAYQALFFASRDVDRLSTAASDPVIPGTYENFTSLLGVNVGWSFGK